ncbi:MAG TPA: choice-of-anchor D domain-containing protein [Candidatus Acidoferrales bacterium]|nr:choice-of-anchor D domain-containing protein [Candidatus Acidoferrales bacterium]
MAFEPNVGQADASVRFIGRGRGLTVLLKRNEIAVRVSKPTSGRAGVVALRLAGEREFKWAGREKLRGETNYLIGDDSRRWRTQVPHFERVDAPDAARGVGIAMYGNDEGVEYDLRLAPGGNASALRLDVSGAEGMRLENDGSLLLRAGKARLRMKKPEIYEEWPGRYTPPRRHVEGGYAIEADGSIGFRVGAHDSNATLVVDPSLSIAYATFLGGSGTDTATSLAVDASGKVYVGGTTTSAATFAEPPSRRLGPADGPVEFFVAKIDPSVSGANSLVYLTILGGSGVQAGGIIAVDHSGNVAITGTTTATDYPVTDASQPTSALASGQGNDVVVSEIDPTGSNLLFSTLFGGSGTESQNAAGGIAVDSVGNVYIASDTHTTSIDSASADLPVTSGAFQTAWDLMPDDGFLAIFQPPAQPGGAPVLKYCTYLGTNSSGGPNIGGIAVDAAGNAYIAGSTSNSANGFPTKNAFQTAYGGGASDAFLMRITPGGSGAQDLVYATLLGGSGADNALAVTVDSATPANAYVTGTTQSPDFPTNGAAAAYQTSLHANAASNAFLAVVAQNALSGIASLNYSTYLGGSHADSGQGVAVTAQNSVYVAGTAGSWDMPWHDNLQPFNGAADAFVAKFDPTSPGAASLIYVTPLGGTSPPGGAASAAGDAVAADPSGHVYVAGTTTSADFPTAVTTQSNVNGFQQICASCQQAPAAADAFVAEIVESAAQMPSVFFNFGAISFPAASVGTVNAPQPVAVLNGGEAPLTISDIEVTGANAGDFSLSGQSACFGQAINPWRGPGTPPGCSFEVGFTPSAVGPEAAVVTVSDNAPGSPHVLELRGVGNGPLASLSPASLNFGNQPENSHSQGLIVTLSNEGNEPLTLANYAVAGPNVKEFTPVQVAGTTACQAGSTFAQGNSCVLQIVFTPDAAQPFQAEIDFFDNSEGVANAKQVLPLSGTGTLPAPIANLSASSLDFGNQPAGSTSGPQSVTLTNAGSAAINITGISIAGSNPAEFAFAPAGTTCPAGGGTLSIGANCTVAVQFSPASGGRKTASINFADNAAGSPQQVALSGTATAPPSLQVSPASLAFASQSEGTVGASQTVTISNTGTSAAGISGITVTGATASDFAPGTPCAPSLATGKSCQMTVSFSPAVSAPPGSRSATLNIPGGNPATVALSGTATQAAIALPASFGFAPQLAGASGVAQPLIVTNSSSGPLAGALTVTSITKTGTNAGDFVLSTDTCTGASTPPGATCAIQVAFKPIQAATCGASQGARSAMLVLADNAPGSPHSIPLSGAASDFCIDTAPGQGVSAPITAGQSATFMLEIDSSAGFTGSATLSCAGAPPPGGVPPGAALLGACVVNTTPATTPPTVQISPGNPGQFQVVVTSTAGGALVMQRPGRRQWPGAKRFPWIAAIWIAIFAAWGIAMWMSTTRSAGKLAQAAMLLLALSVAMAACGGGDSGLPAAPPPGPPPLVTYKMDVTATVTVPGQPDVIRDYRWDLTIQ